ncbi:tripartite tricarboxylate transporter TctB family protein [Phyllobacterium salinisoli]|uniref:Tripartite tricarboxylate transporter TctB family protein n=1 Tax=Phyllobacterium salinisoli TaxID=1899321 RepID=A0A368JYT8_9HYPH|nr:tripartite tricarboxylate transporter TctB family protein [Phyllobacterium salinisoli]RCS22064.1 tripartite tricarboxylate transporter TctB family protein [Phyllobacterium salinisoli]
MSKQQTRRPGAIAFNAVILGFSLFMFWQAYLISGFSALSSPGTFPMAMSAIMVLTSAGILIKSLGLSSPGGGFTGFRKEILPPIVLLFSLIILAFSLVLKPLGFLLASFLFLLSSIWLLERGRFGRALLLSVVSIIGVYVIFRLIFQVVLPEGIIPERAIISTIGDYFSGRH